MKIRTWCVFQIFFAIICFVPGIVNATDTVHHVFVNNTSEPITVEVQYQNSNPADSASNQSCCLPSTDPPEQGTNCSGPYVVGPYQNSGEVCSFNINVGVWTACCGLGAFQFGNYIVNGVALPGIQQWSINDPDIGPLILESGGPTNVLLKSGDYTLTYTYGGGCRR